MYIIQKLNVFHISILKIVLGQNQLYEILNLIFKFLISIFDI